MKSKAIIRHIIIITLIAFTFEISCNGQNNTGMRKNDTIKVRVKIIKSLAIGWGVKYQASIEKIVGGNTKDFNDTIIFGITAERNYQFLKVGDTCLITFQNTKKINNKPYLPSITGTISKLNEVWLIKKIENITSINERRIFMGSAIISNGKSVFIWDFSDSQAFYLDGLESWDLKYLNKKITIEGILIKYIDGVYTVPVIKDWKILSPN